MGKFKTTVSRHCVLRVLKKNDRLEALVKADPELERKRIKNIQTVTKVPIEILTAHDEVESENLQKLCYEMDQMYIEQDFRGNDEEEMVILELIPENEDQ